MRKIVFALVTLIALCFFAPSIAMRKDISKTQSQNSAGLTLGYHRADAYERGDATNVTKILADQAGKKGDWVRTINKICLSFVNIIAVCFLIFVALANILQYDIQKYAIKAIIPRLVGAVIAANLIMPVIVFASRLVDNLQSISIFQPLGPGGWFMFVFGDNIWQVVVGVLLQLGAGAVAGFFTGGFSWVVQGLIFGVVILFIILAVLLLSLIFAFRTYIVLLCAAVAPLAIICYALPQTSKLCERWLKILYPWLILPVLTNFILRTTSLLPAGSEMTVGGGTGPLTNIIGFFFPLMFRILVLVLVIRLPFKLESDIGGLIATGGKWLGSNAWKWGVGYGMGAGAYTRQKRREDIAGNRAADLERVRGSRRGLTPEQIEVNAQVQRERAIDMVKNDTQGRALQWMQSNNPYGISAALRERGEVMGKDIEKSHYRSSRLTAGALGRGINFKHQSAIQREDLSNLNELGEVEESLRVAFTDLFRNYMAANPGMSEAVAILALTNDLESLNIEQASKEKYMARLGPLVSDGEAAKLAEGFYRQRLLIERAIPRSSNLAARRNYSRYLLEDSNVRMLGAATTVGPPVAPPPPPSGSPGPTPSGSPSDVEQMADNSAQIEGNAEMVKILGQIRDGLRNPRGQSSRLQVADLVATSARIDELTNGSVDSLYSQSGSSLEVILKRLISKGIGRETALQFVRTLREKRGLEPIGTSGDEDLDQLISEDESLGKLVSDYEVGRIAQVAIQSQTPDGKSAAQNANLIINQSRGTNPSLQKQQIEEACNTVVRGSMGEQIAPEALEKAKADIGKVLGLGGETVDRAIAERLLSGSEVAFRENQSGQFELPGDSANVSLRVAIQQERNMFADGLGKYAQSVAGSSVDDNVGELQARVRSVVEPHMELRHTDQWRAQSAQVKEKIIADVTDSLRGAIGGSIAGASQEVASAASEIGAKIKGLSPAQISEGIGTITPLLAEKMFQSRIGK